MLANISIAQTVASKLAALAARPFVVYDPVMAASSGEALAGPGFVDAIREWLLQLVDCLTPNLARGGGAARRGGRARRSGHGAARQGAAQARAPRRPDEGRTSRRRRGGSSGDGGRCPPLRRSAHRLASICTAPAARSPAPWRDITRLAWTFHEPSRRPRPLCGTPSRAEKTSGSATGPVLWRSRLSRRSFRLRRASFMLEERGERPWPARPATSTPPCPRSGTSPTSCVWRISRRCPMTGSSALRMWSARPTRSPRGDTRPSTWSAPG